MVSAKNDQIRKAPGDSGAAEGPRPDRDLGNALRRAYDETVKESVPDDLLDLLKKLD